VFSSRSIHSTFIVSLVRFCLAHQLLMHSSDFWSVFLSVCLDVYLSRKEQRRKSNDEPTASATRRTDHAS
jgi:hypothetical protein